MNPSVPKRSLPGALPSGPVEHVVFWGMLSPFLLYFSGLEPLRIPLTVWPAILISFALVLKSSRPISWLSWLWLACMSGLLIQQVFFFQKYDVGGWTLPGWFLGLGIAGVLPMVGQFVRPQVVYFAAALLGIQALIYCAIAGIAVQAGFEPHYRSPLPQFDILESAYYNVRLTQSSSADDAEQRLIAFAPYATSAGATACFFAILTLGARASWFKWTGLAGWLLLLLLARARTGIICTAVAIAFFHLLSIRRRYLLLIAGAGVIVLSAFAGPITRGAEEARDYLHALRWDSSLDRNNLKSIALSGWRYGERPALGNGTSIPGGAVVTHVPIGTHDSLAGGLFLRGALGVSLMLLPILVTLVFGSVSGTSPTHRIVAASAAVMVIYTYSQTLTEIFMFMWPLFLLIGAASRQEELPESLPASTLCTPSALH